MSENTGKPVYLIDSGEIPTTPYYVAPPTGKTCATTDYYSLIQSAPLRILESGPASELPRLLKECEQLNAEYDYSLEATLARIHNINAINEYHLAEQLREALRQKEKES